MDEAVISIRKDCICEGFWGNVYMDRPLMRNIKIRMISMEYMRLVDTLNLHVLSGKSSPPMEGNPTRVDTPSPKPKCVEADDMYMIARM